MEYIKPELAQEMPGLRLALTAGVPAPYSMSAKAILTLKQVDFVPVLQQGAGRNEELLAWTGHRNAPVAVYADEAPRAGWLDILNLAERLGSGPPLLPENRDERMQMVAWANELIGEDGWVWQLRLLMLGVGGPEKAAAAAQKNPMYAQYGYSEAALATAEAKARDTLQAFTAFAAQTSHPHYLIGERLSALDIYWVFFSQLADVLPHEQCPTPDGLRRSYEYSGQVIGGCDAALIERRNWVLTNHLTVPLDF
ncbi:MAG: hypothetical protein AAF993_21885 [Pseudomonadota bacterium]